MKGIMSGGIEDYVVKIMGLEAGEHGHSCCKHKICVVQVKAGQVLKIWCIKIVNVNSKSKKALGV